MIDGIKNFLIESHNVYVSYGYIKPKKILTREICKNYDLYV